MIAVCASRGGSQVRGPDAPPPKPSLRGMYRSPLGACGPVFFSRQRSVETIFPRGPPSLTAGSVPLPSPHPRPSQLRVQEGCTPAEEHVVEGRGVDPWQTPGRALAHLFTVCLLISRCTSFLLAGKRRLS